jgi:alkaline phosphatase
MISQKNDFFRNFSIYKSAFTIKPKSFALQSLSLIHIDTLLFYILMGDTMFDTIGTWLVDMMYTVWYPGLIFATFLENFIPPIPSEVIMPLGGYLASIGKMNLILVILLWSLWSTLGTLPYFFIGKYFTKHKISDFVDRYGKYFRYDTRKLDNLYDIFNKNDSSRVFFARFLPGARSLISLPAGSADMDFTKFISLTFVGTAIRTTLWTLIGYFFWQKQDMIMTYFREYEHYALYLLIVIVIIVIVWSVNRPTKEEME